MVFVEDYDMKVARELVQGVDLWLNNPRRGEEACGTSGMKAGINGVLNLSILDGWFDEAYENSGGWAIGDREPYTDDQDALHASAIYYLLENEIVPMFYEHREQTPREWMRRVKQSLTHISPPFDCRRMVHEYMTELYEPAHSGHLRMRKADYALSREKAQWNARIREVWDRVRFVEAGPGPSGSRDQRQGRPGARRHRPGRADAGRCARGSRDRPRGFQWPPGRYRSYGAAFLEQQGSVAVFAKDIVPERTGRLGYALRVSPNHYDDPLTRPCRQSAEVEFA